MAEPYAPLFSRLSLLGATLESTPGTQATVSAALSNTAIYNAKMVPTDWFSGGQRRPIGDTGPVTSTRGPQLGKLTFQQDLRYNDAFGTLIQAAGFKLTASVYGPTQDFTYRKTITFKLWENGRVKVLYGAVGTCTIELAANQRAVANWEFTGIFLETVAAEALPSYTPISTAPWMCRGMTLTLDAANIAHTSKVVIDLGNNIEMRENLPAATGMSHAFIAESTRKLTLDPEARLPSQYDVYDKLYDGTTVAFIATLTDGGAPAHTLSIAAPVAQYQTVGDEDRGGRRVDPVELLCCISAGSDELTFTVA